MENLVIASSNDRSIIGEWDPKSYIERALEDVRRTVGNDKVILALSGGVDSTVTAVLINKAIGSNLHCIFVNHGLLRKGEFEEVLTGYRQLGLNVKGVDAEARFLEVLKGVTDPELKRKAIGKTFIDVFDEESKKVEDAKWLGQGTIWPDIAESLKEKGGAKVKSHHNVGGLPENMKLQLVEPIRLLYKNEVREVGLALGIPEVFIMRHPFPGPSLGIRVLGEVTKERLDILREADKIFIDTLRNTPCDLPCASIPGRRATNWYDAVWQAMAILLPVKSTGIKNGSRTYANVVTLRAITSTNALTADAVQLPWDMLNEVAVKIINQVEGINRVVYDISPKPPATIEWE